jgi:hypothetical protein
MGTTSPDKMHQWRNASLDREGREEFVDCRQHFGSIDMASYDDVEAQSPTTRGEEPLYAALRWERFLKYRSIEVTGIELGRWALGSK